MSRHTFSAALIRLCYIFLFSLLQDLLRHSRSVELSLSTYDAIKAGDVFVSSKPDVIPKPRISCTRKPGSRSSGPSEEPNI